MKNSSLSSLKPLIKKSFFASPIELKIFISFSFLVLILDIILNTFGSKELKESIIPITGWNMSTFYSTCAIIGFFFILGLARNAFRIRNILILMLIFIILFGIYSFTESNGAYYSPNPYLSVSQWRPIWTMAIPALWILVLFSPRIKKYCLFLNETHKDFMQK
jgi:hypothetical protein